MELNKMHICEQISQRNNKILDEDIKYREGLSKAATLYYKSEFNAQRNKRINERVGRNANAHTYKTPKNIPNCDESKMLDLLNSLTPEQLKLLTQYSTENK
ncbi:hypothetical protein [Klebsiella quasivariicola]|uniref:hypothetical protein n=1 Tax=Klebsiella quasivariicola TaxID=2026240 RepID=UPI0024799318|nr:hypothetical protein [Klebsiella quasivariicola]